MKAVDVAAYIQCSPKVIDLDVWHLHTLVFYVNAWSCVWNGRSLVDGDFEAWPEGPLCQPLAALPPKSEDVPREVPNTFPKEAGLIIDAVLDHYAALSADRLWWQVCQVAPFARALHAARKHPGDSSVRVVNSKEMLLFFYQEARQGRGPNQPEGVPTNPTIEDIHAASEYVLEKWGDVLDALANM